jgi:hypothetical protein
MNLSDEVRKQEAKRFTEVASIFENISSSVGISISSAIAITDVISKALGRSFSETVTILDNYATAIGKVYGVVDYIGITDSNNPIFSVAKVLAALQTLSDAISKESGITIDSAFALVESMTKTSGTNRAIADLVTISEYESKNYVKTRQEMTYMSEFSTLKSVYERGLVETITVAENLYRLYDLPRTDNVHLAATIMKYAAWRGPADTIVLNDSMFANSGKKLSDLMAMADYYSSWRDPGFSDTVAVAEARRVEIEMTKSDSFVFHEMLQYSGVGRFVLRDSVSFVASVEKVSSFFRHFTIAIDIIESLTKDLGISRADATIVLSEAITKIFGKKKTDSVTLLDLIDTSPGLKQSNFDSVTVSEELAKRVGKIDYTSVSFIEAMAKAISLRTLDAETLQIDDSVLQDLGTGKTAFISDSVTLIDALTIAGVLKKNETIVISEENTFSSGKKITSIAQLSDSTSKGLSIYITDDEIFDDSQTGGIPSLKSFSDVFYISDDLSHIKGINDDGRRTHLVVSKRGTHLVSKNASKTGFLTSKKATSVLRSKGR